MSSVTLMSMAPSGETFITRDARGRTWLHKPAGAGGGGMIDDRTAALAVTKHGFDRVERVFDTWVDLDEFRLSRAAMVTPAVVVDRDNLDLDDATQLLGTGRRWIAEGLGERALRLATNLLRVPAVIADPTTREAVLALLDELSRSPVVPIRVLEHPEYWELWQQVQPAA